MTKAHTATSDVQRTKVCPASANHGASNHKRPVTIDTSPRANKAIRLARAKYRAPGLCQRKTPTPAPTTKGITPHNSGTQYNQPNSSQPRTRTLRRSQVPSACCNSTSRPVTRASSSSIHTLRCKSKNRSKSSCRGSMDGASTATMLSSAKGSTGSPPAVTRRNATNRWSASPLCCTLIARDGAYAKTPCPCGSGAKRQPRLGSRNATPVAKTTQSARNSKHPARMPRSLPAIWK